MPRRPALALVLQSCPAARRSASRRSTVSRPPVRCLRLRVPRRLRSGPANRLRRWLEPLRRRVPRSGGLLVAAPPAARRVCVAPFFRAGARPLASALRPAGSPRPLRARWPGGLIPPATPFHKRASRATRLPRGRRRGACRPPVPPISASLRSAELPAILI